MYKELIRDRLHERAARVQPECSETNRQMASAFDVDESRCSHWKSDDRYSPFVTDLRAARTLAKGLNTTPVPHMIEIESVLMEAYLEGKSDAWLVRRWRELRDHEHDRQAAEDRAGQCAVPKLDPGMDEDEWRQAVERRREYREALRTEAWLQIELAAIDELLEQKRIDPREDG